MKQTECIILITIVLVSGAISFFATRMIAVARQESNQRISFQWLGGAPDEVLEIEKNFNTESDELIKTLMKEQKSLALMLEEVSATDETIVKQAEIASRAHEKLIRSVAEHIIEIHRKLPLTQQHHLMQLCAESVRGSTHRLDEQRGAYCEACRGEGDLPCPGSGSSDERPKCCKICINRKCVAKRKGFTQMLKLSKEQLNAIKQKDPTFEAESENLSRQLVDERSKLLTMFENIETNDKSLRQQVDRLILVHNTIEKRVVEYVVVLRSSLTPEQQKWLVGLCFRED